jgi:hypothetical protein
VPRRSPVASSRLTTELTVTAGQPFVLVLDNQDAAVPHNAQFKDSAGAVVSTTDTFNGVETREFQVRRWPGTYHSSAPSTRT